MSSDDSSLINIRDFIFEWSNLLVDMNFDSATDNSDEFKVFVSTEMDIPQDMIDELDTVCRHV